MKDRPSMKHTKHTFRYSCLFEKVFVTLFDFTVILRNFLDLSDNWKFDFRYMKRLDDKQTLCRQWFF